MSYRLGVGQNMLCFFPLHYLGKLEEFTHVYIAVKHQHGSWNKPNTSKCR